MPSKPPQYLPWRLMIPRDIVLSTVLAFGEGVAERIFLPGLHRAPGRVIDPARVDDLATFVSFTIGFKLTLIWMFFLGLYTISFFTTRPIKRYATAIVGAGLMIVTFIGATFEWFAMPVPVAPPTLQLPK